MSAERILSLVAEEAIPSEVTSTPAMISGVLGAVTLKSATAEVLPMFLTATFGELEPGKVDEIRNFNSVLPPMMAA